jgi:hypothetical protein
LLNVSTATPAGVGILIPPTAMMAGYGAVPELGKETDTVNAIDFPESEILMVRVLPE